MRQIGILELGARLPRGGGMDPNGTPAICTLIVNVLESMS